MLTRKFMMSNYYEIDWSTVRPGTPILYVVNGRAYIATYVCESRNLGRIIIDMEYNGTYYKNAEARSCDAVLIENVNHYTVRSKAIAANMVQP